MQTSQDRRSPIITVCTFRQVVRQLREVQRVRPLHLHHGEEDGEVADQEGDGAGHGLGMDGEKTVKVSCIAGFGRIV